MASEAILAIKKAEDEGKEIIKQATEEAKKIAASYAKNLQEQKDSIMVRARHTRESMVNEAAEKAQRDCEELERQGKAEKETILSPDDKKLEQAIKFITERIVSV